MDNLIACHGCDLLVDVGNLEDDSRAYCPRCGHFLTRYQRDGRRHEPRARLRHCRHRPVTGGQQFSVFILQTGRPRKRDDALRCARFAGPLRHAGAGPDRGHLHHHRSVLDFTADGDDQRTHAATRAVFALQNWSMAEVFIIGVLVSLVKIMSLATVILGISFWAYSAFSICFILALVSLDRYQCWQLIDQLEAQA
jgi:paraquat-inducible protein A